MAAAVKLGCSSLDAMKSLVPVCHHLFTKHLHFCILWMHKGFAMQSDAKFLFFKHWSPIKFLSQLALVLSIIVASFFLLYQRNPHHHLQLLCLQWFFSSLLFSFVRLLSSVAGPTFSSLSCLLPLVPTSFSLLVLSSVSAHFFLPSLVFIFCWSPLLSSFSYLVFRWSPLFLPLRSIIIISLLLYFFLQCLFFSLVSQFMANWVRVNQHPL